MGNTSEIQNSCLAQTHNTRVSPHKFTEHCFYRGLYFGYPFPGFPCHDLVNVGLAAVDQAKDHVDESQGTSQAQPAEHVCML